jgi:hypothetical protein
MTQKKKAATKGMKKHPTEQQLAKLLGDGIDVSTFRCEDFILVGKGDWEYNPNEEAQLDELIVLAKLGAPKPKPNTRLGIALERFTSE